MHAYVCMHTLPPHGPFSSSVWYVAGSLHTIRTSIHTVHHHTHAPLVRCTHSCAAPTRALHSPLTQVPSEDQIIPNGCRLPNEVRLCFESLYATRVCATFLRFSVSAFLYFYVSMFLRFYVSTFLRFYISTFLHFYVSSSVSSFLRFYALSAPSALVCASVACASRMCTLMLPCILFISVDPCSVMLIRHARCAHRSPRPHPPTRRASRQITCPSSRTSPSRYMYASRCRDVSVPEPLAGLGSCFW
jgi:hypothetical protein